MNIPFSPENFKEALSRFATGVTVVTALSRKKIPIGMTVNSFNSVSLDPPLILWSVGKNNLAAENFRDAENFAVHLLHTGQVDLSTHFATNFVDKFKDIPHTPTHLGIPKIHGTLTCFHCKRWAVYEGGDHWIIVGNVLDIEKSESKNIEPLVYHQGVYASSRPIDS